jgi:alpha-glucosidase
MEGGRYAADVGLRGWSAAGPGRALLDLGTATGELSVAEDGSVRLRAASGPGLAPDPAPAVGRLAWQPASARPVAREGGGLRIEHDGPLGAVRLDVAPDPLRLSVLGRRGEVVAELGCLAFGAGGSGRLALSAGPHAHFFGLGERHGHLDKRGERVLLRNRDPALAARDPMYVSIPFLLALERDSRGARACGLLLDAFGTSRFDVAAGSADRVVLESAAGGIDVSLFPGPLPADVLRRFTARVGRTPLPPLWALGHHQSRWGYRSERDVREVAAELRARRIPSDVIHLDIDHMDGYRVFTWDPRRFPDPKQLLADLAARGFRAVVIVDPGVKVDPHWDVYREGAARGVFCRRDDGGRYTLRVWPGEVELPDFDREEVRAWWGERHRPLLEAGVSGIWNDMNEPAGWSRDLRLGRAMLPLGRQDVSRLVQVHPAEDRRVPHEEVRNLYGLQECRATRTFLESAEPQRRHFVLTRSGHAGIQRYAAVWTGDNRSRWEDLRESIPMLLNLSLSGVAFCGADIGGFAGTCTPELYARWIQLGALYPFARTHSMWLSPRQEPWSFGARVESIAREALRLRMRLMPYLDGLFRQAESCGAPVWRPLFYEFPDDPDAVGPEDQLMLGPALLVAPVVEQGARQRSVYLPPGVWIDWHDGARWVGARRIQVAAPLERIPLFARGGTILPTRSPVGWAGEAPEEPCVLEVFPGADGGGELFEDDGESTAYRAGAMARTALRLWHRAGGRLRIEIGRREGGFPVAERLVRVAIHACPRPHSVHLDGVRLEEGGVAPGFTAGEGRVDVRFREAGGGHVLELDPAP